MTAHGRFSYPVSLALLLLLAATPILRADDYREERERLVRHHIVGAGIEDRETIRSMRTVRREEFVPIRLRNQAYANQPLPIGYGQTISQPYIVALMTELLSVDADDRVLEIGTGSGYQAAVLAHIVTEVYTIEIIEPLGQSARQRLARLGYDNVRVKIDDGYFGWEEHASFDCIMITAAVNHIPLPLFRQLKDAGRLILPLGNPYSYQELVLVTKKGEDYTISKICGVLFVPMTGTAMEKTGQ